MKAYSIGIAGVLLLASEAQATLPVFNILTSSDCGRYATSPALLLPERITEEQPSFWGIAWEGAASGIEWRNSGLGARPNPKATVDGNRILVQMFMSFTPEIGGPLPPSTIGCGSLPRLRAGRYAIRFEAHNLNQWPPFYFNWPANSNYHSPLFRADYVFETEIEVLPGPVPIPAGHFWTWALLGVGVLLTPLAFRTRMQ